jgi:hypothetical protein
MWLLQKLAASTTQAMSKCLMVQNVPYILESNAHPNLMRTPFLATSDTTTS